MLLWLRQQDLKEIDSDLTIQVGSQAEWHQAIEEYRPISSVLWRQKPLFRLLPEVTEDIFGRHHPHERMPTVPDSIFKSYKAAAERLAVRLKPIIQNRKALIYAPLRGAYPIWKAISRFLPTENCHVYYSVTSSFVFYPEDWGIRNHKGQTHSGRFANILELKRLKPALNTFDLMVYVDEVVSGSMMYAHLKEMKEVNIRRHIPVMAVGLADAFGTRSDKRRAQIEAMKTEGLIVDFLWEGCDCLITEDNKFMLGWHYVDYDFGPNVVPVLDKELELPDELNRFKKEILTPA